MVKLSIKANKRHHNPPEGVVVAEESDCQMPVVSLPGGHLLFYHKVWEQTNAIPELNSF